MLLFFFYADVKAKVGSSPFIKCHTQFSLILWHPYAHHHYFCVASEKEQQKWLAVLQDCVRHTSDGGFYFQCKIFVCLFVCFLSPFSQMQKFNSTKRRQKGSSTSGGIFPELPINTHWRNRINVDGKSAHHHHHLLIPLQRNARPTTMLHE